MKLFVCIDDTDNYDSIGTGELLENMMGEAAIKGLAKAGFTVRYQLFIHDDIPYTSHNSSMCCAAAKFPRLSTEVKAWISKGRFFLLFRYSMKFTAYSTSRSHTANIFRFKRYLPYTKEY